MTFSFLQQRAIRVLTRPPEILFALTRHAVLVGVCALLGAGLVWAMVVAQPPIYEARAQLLISKNDSILASLSSLSQTDRRAWRDLDLEVFLNAQSSVLRSKEVLEKLILCTGFSWGAAGSESDREESETVRDHIAALKGTVKTWLSEILLLEAPERSGADPEIAMQRSIESFQRRSEVKAEKSSSTIDLLVRGEDSERLKQELRCWIEAYKNHLTEMARETWDGFLSELSTNYSRRKDSAAAELAAFRAANPGVSESKIDFLKDHIRELYFELADLRRRQLELAVPAANVLSVDPEYRALITRKIELETEKELYPASSSKSALVQKQLDYVSSELAAYMSALSQAKSLDDSNGDTPYDSRLAILTGDIRSLSDERDRVSDKLKQLEELETRYNSATETLDHFEAMKLASLHMQSPLNVQISDDPAVDSSPVGLDPLTKICLGSLAGLFLGVFCALLFEILCGKVRFKRDVIDDFGLSVVAVLPR